MGLFDKKDKKRKDDFDSPVDRVDLTPAPASAAPAPSVGAKPAPAAEPPRPAVAATPAVAAPAPAVAPPAPAAAALAARPAPAAAAAPDSDDYGIDKAIELMRTLPSDNVELVVQVVKFSLESVGIQLPTIIKDAIRRQNDLQSRVGMLRSEIADLEAEIKLRKEEIEKHEADHKETTMVRDRLELAEKLGKGSKPAAKDAGAEVKEAVKDAVAAPAAKTEPAAAAAGTALPALGTARGHTVTGQTAVIPPKK